MLKSRTCISVVVVLTYFAAAAGSAQSQVSQDVSRWTEKEFAAAKLEWLKNKTKFSGCQQQALAQKLSGQASWQAIYNCMGSNAQANPQAPAGYSQQQGGYQQAGSQTPATRQPPPGYKPPTGSQYQH